MANGKEPRRQHEDDFKRKVVAEARVPDRSVNEVASV